MSLSPSQPQDETQTVGDPDPLRMTLPGKERRRADTRLRTLVTMNADGLLVVGRDDGVIRFANPAAGTLLGQTPERLIGQPFGTPVPPGQTADIDVVCSSGERCVAE